LSLRDHLRKLDEQNKLIHITKPFSKTYEIAVVLEKREPRRSLPRRPEVGLGASIKHSPDEPLSQMQQYSAN
jgi:hypothetical protein